MKKLNKRWDPINQKVKRECHALMDYVYGKTPSDRKKAYRALWTGTAIKHFADCDDYGELFKARMFLYQQAMKKGITLDELEIISEL